MLPSKRIRPIKSDIKWLEKAIEGHYLIRDGVDYVNNNNRYDKAHNLLSESYKLAKNNASEYDLARICLWNGISMNENLTIPHIRRNKIAIELYKKGLEHIKRSNESDDKILPIKSSLYNSLGVANHHLVVDKIPKISYYYYKKSRDIFRNNPQLYKKLIRIMNKVEYNTGHRIMRGGGGNYI